MYTVGLGVSVYGGRGVIGEMPDMGTGAIIPQMHLINGIEVGLIRMPKVCS